MSGVLKDVRLPTDCLVDRDCAEHFECTICYELVVVPMQCKEGHLFCRACIERALQTKKNCPTCRRPLRNGDLCRNLVLEKIMDKMTARCVHAAQHTEGEDCGWVGKVSEWQSHLDDECQYAEVPCPHDGCEVRVQRRVMVEHSTSCEQRVEACGLGCGEGVVFAHRVQHEEVCPLVPVVCPRPGCSVGFLRKDTGAHEQVCPEMPVECEYHASGCTPDTLLRKDEAAHRLVCPMVQVGCDSCTETFPRHTRADHKTTCLMAKVSCPRGCGAGFKRRDAASHEGQCPLTPVLCRRGCGEEYTRKDAAQHDTTCLMVAVPCEFAECGCQHSPPGGLLRKDVAQHERDAAAQHAELALAALKTYKVRRPEGIYTHTHTHTQMKYEVPEKRRDPNNLESQRLTKAELLKTYGVERGLHDWQISAPKVPKVVKPAQEKRGDPNEPHSTNTEQSGKEKGLSDGNKAGQLAQQAEKRRDPRDKKMYTKAEFLAAHGKKKGLDLWNAASKTSDKKKGMKEKVEDCAVVTIEKIEGIIGWVRDGCFVMDVDADSAAAKAGVKPNHKILAVNGKTVDTNSISGALKKAKATLKVSIE